jgi:hypothetical protein
MGSDAPRPVGTVGATNRTVVAITVMPRIWLANSHSPVGADTPSPIYPIDTSGCVAWLGEHERAKSHHDGKYRCAIYGESLHNVFHFGFLLVSRERETYFMPLGKALICPY